MAFLRHAVLEMRIAASQVRGLEGGDGVDLDVLKPPAESVGSVRAVPPGFRQDTRRHRRSCSGWDTSCSTRDSRLFQPGHWTPHPGFGWDIPGCVCDSDGCGAIYLDAV